MANPKKRIVIVCHYYPPHMGGIELVAKNQAERLAARGHEVTVVTAQVSRAEYSGMMHGVRVIRVKALNLLERRGVPFPIVDPFRLLTTLTRVIRKADVVHVHDVIYMPCFIAATVAKIMRRPLVLTQHVAVVPHRPAVVAFQKFMHNTFGKIVYKTSQIAFTLNDVVERHVLQHGVRPKRHVPTANGVDTDLFRPATEYEKIAARVHFGLSLDKIVVLFVGRLVPKKGFDKVLATRHPDYQLVFAGGELHTGDEPDVLFLGKLPQEKLAELYRAADIFVLPSEGEGFPLSVQEAMASGLPIITTDDEGYARYNLDPNFVSLLKNPTAAKVGAAIAELTGDAAKRYRMGEYSRRYAESYFSWDRIIKELDRTYDMVLAQKGVA